MATLTPVFRVSYPSVFKPRLNKLSGKEEYSLEALFPLEKDMSSDDKKALQGLKKAVEEAVINKWGPEKAKWPKNIRLPFKMQDEKENEEGLRAPYQKGAMFLRLKSDLKPGLVDQNVNDIIDTSDFYPGCYARASVNAFAYDQAGNRGVSLSLANIQKVKDGDPLGGRTKPEHDFAPIESSDSSATELFDN